MNTSRHTPDVRRRPGFTLVELLVAMALIATLAGLTVLLLPGYNLREQVSTGAARLQGWLVAAKQRALLDRAPRGVRLVADSSGQFLTEGVYIEQPDDFGTGDPGSNRLTVQTDTGDATNKKLTFSSSTNLKGDFPSDQTLWPVQPGDFIQFHTSGLVHQIASIDSDTTATLLNALNPPINQPASFRIVRQPRVTSEEPMLMPADVAVDLSNTYTLNISQRPPLNGGVVDIMFSPSGQVWVNGSASSASRLTFLVREISDPLDPLSGEPTLIVLYPRTGVVASFEAIGDSTDVDGMVR